MCMEKAGPPKVSVIVPIYKVAAYLPKCVESLRAQTLREMEIILVDDGSPDECPRLCDDYAAEDPRIRVLHKQNEGVFLARRSGLEMASGDYVGFVDGDDFAAPDMYETLWQEAQRQKAQVVCSSIIRYWSEEKQRPESTPRNLTGTYSGEALADFYGRFFFDNTPRALAGSILPALSDKLFRRELVLRIYGELPREYGRIRVGEDMLVCYGSLLQADRISVLGNYCPLYYFQRPGSVMNSFKPDALENTERLLAALEALKKPQAAEAPVARAIRRFGGYKAVHIALGIVPEDAAFPEKWKRTVEVVRYLRTSPLWADKLREDGDDIFAYGFEKMIYKMLKAGMGRSIAVCSRLHQWRAGRKEMGRSK